MNGINQLKKTELYHYDKVFFESYAAYSPQLGLKPTNPTKFLTHHHLKVIPEEAVRADFWIDEDYIHLVKVYEPCQTWREVTDPKDIEATILERNKQHLQQAGIEQGRVHSPVMQKILAGNGTNDLVQQFLKEEITIDNIVDKAI